MKILAFEFSSSQRSVALVWRETGEKTLVVQHPEPTQPPGAVPAYRVHGPGTFAYVEAMETGAKTMQPFALIDQVLSQAQAEREQIDVLALGTGPGSYTGIRAAIAMAQGWQLAANLKLLPVPSHQTLVEGAREEGIMGDVAVIIDAQRNEFYCSTFHLTADQCEERTPLRLCSADEVRQVEAGGCRLIGPDVQKWFPSARPLYPTARVLGRLALNRAGYVEGSKIEPVYLRETSYVKAPPLRPIPPA